MTRTLRDTGIAWVVLGAIGIVVSLATGHQEKLIGVAGWLILGAILYFATARSRAKERQPKD